MDKQQEYAAFEVNDRVFEEACKNAPYWARKRCLKKMTKVVWRSDGFKKLAEPCKPNETRIGMVALTSSNPDKRACPPSDVEDYVKKFCFHYQDKGVVDEEQGQEVAPVFGAGVQPEAPEHA